MPRFVLCKEGFRRVTGALLMYGPSSFSMTRLDIVASRDGQHIALGRLW